MTGVPAVYYDGRSALGREVSLRFDAAGNLEIEGLAAPLRYRAAELSYSPRIGNIPRSLALPGGARCEIADNDAIDAALAAGGAGRHDRALHLLESRWTWILLLFAVAGGVIWGTVRFVVPELARQAAFSLPVDADRSLAGGVLETLDRAFLKPSKLEAARRKALESRFKDITRGVPGSYRFRLEFRASPVLGPNALALPDGTIVLTDELVALAAGDDELLGVLAHEVGHVVHRHALRSVLQSAAVTLIVAFAMGDVVSLTSLAAALPTMLVEAKFSRDFEREADGYALDFLRSGKLSPRPVAAFLRRMAEHHGEPGQAFSYLSSHPATEERIRMFSVDR
jgi:Zn-dependent protease with chaperone function